MTQNLEPGSLVHVCKQASVLVDRYIGLKNDSAVRLEGQRAVVQSLDVIKEALDKFKYEELALSFNGGKDCLVLLILLMAALYRKCEKDSSYMTRQSISCVYVQCTNAFREVDEFVDTCNDRYQLETTTLLMGMKEALEHFLQTHNQVKAIFVGIRRTDPFGAELKSFQKTDHGWPNFIRIHPVIDWHLIHIWDFLRTLQIPYCSLYDRGYTSLGGTDNTIRNPALETDGEYLPAYKLSDDLKERLGRT